MTKGWANADLHRRELVPVKTRRRCWCGCGQRATHHGTANGIALTAPTCELQARRWVRDGTKAVHLAIEAKNRARDD